MRPFCAICTAEIDGEPRRRDLGRHGALVNVCRSCDEDVPIARDATRGYVAPGGVLGMAAAVRRLEAELGAQADRGRNETAVERTPGYVLVRVPIRDDAGRVRDHHEARATFAHQPWAAQARYLSTTNPGRAGVHIFERPGAVARDHGDQLAALEQFRVRR